MDLLFLVWGIDLLLKTVTFSKVFLTVMFGLSVLWVVTGFMACVENAYSSEDFKRHFKKYYPYKLIILAGFLVFLIPSPQTMKYMGAAYLLQSTFESKFVKETATLSQKAIINQLKVWAEDSPDIVPMLENIGVEVKEKALQEVNKVLESNKTLEESK